MYSTVPSRLFLRHPNCIFFINSSSYITGVQIAPLCMQSVLYYCFKLCGCICFKVFVYLRAQNPVWGQPRGWGGTWLGLWAVDLLSRVERGFACERGFLWSVYRHTDHTAGAGARWRGATDLYILPQYFFWKWVLMQPCVFSLTGLVILTGFWVSDRSINKEQ